ncbi:MAG: hypothetical protein AAFU78_20770 [Cyanobacteria bacterium J06633_2]
MSQVIEPTHTESAEQAVVDDASDEMLMRIIYGVLKSGQPFDPDKLLTSA